MKAIDGHIVGTSTYYTYLERMPKQARHVNEGAPHRTRGGTGKPLWYSV